MTSTKWCGDNQRKSINWHGFDGRTFNGHRWEVDSEKKNYQRKFQEEKQPFERKLINWGKYTK